LTASPTRRSATITGFIAALLVATLAPAASAHTVQAATVTAPLDLPLSGFSEMVVDDAHSHIFITGFSALSGFTGTADSKVVVANMDGTLDTTLADVAGAAGMYLDAANHTLYVAENEGDAVQPIDTVSLTKGTPFGLGTNADCPFDVSKAGAYLWTNIGCGANAGGMARIDLNTSAVTPYANGGGGQLLEGSGNSLFTADTFSSPSAIEKFDVTGGTPTLDGTTGGSFELDSLNDITIAPDGSVIYAASGYPYSVESFATSNLALDTQYPTEAYPVAVAVSPDSSWVAGASKQSDPEIFVFSAGSTTLVNGFPDPEVGGQVTPRGIAIGADDTIFAITGIGDSGTGSPVLNLITDPTVPRSEITLTPQDSSIRVTTQATLTGTLTFTDGVPTGVQTLHVVRTDPDSTQTALSDVTTDSTGGFTFHDTPPQVGTATYEVTFDGISGHRRATGSAGVLAEKRSTTITLKASAKTVDYGKAMRLTAHLNAFDPGQVVDVFAKPYGGSKLLIKAGSVDGSGILTLKVRPAGETTFSAASIEGPSYLSAASGSVKVEVHPVFAGKMLGGYATKNRYREYHFTETCPGSHKGCPVSAFALAPNHAGRSVDVTLQLRAPSGWKTAASFRGKLSKKSVITVLWFYNNSNVIGIRARVRATFGGDADHLSARSSYLFFIVTR
jgi:hypothetical protein